MDAALSRPHAGHSRLARRWRVDDGGKPRRLLRPPPDDALQEWIVSRRVNKAGVGDDDSALIEPLENA
jgi:putative SOS response-associated peptidase YedK